MRSVPGIAANEAMPYEDPDIAAVTDRCWCERQLISRVSFRVNKITQEAIDFGWLESR